jgi:hypothetical protein
MINKQRTPSNSQCNGNNLLASLRNLGSGERGGAGLTATPSNKFKKNGSKVLTKLIDNCLIPGTASFTNCYNTIIDLDCEDFKELSGTFSCKDIDEAVQYINSPAAVNDVQSALNWYNQDFVPCVSRLCAPTKNPVSEQQLQQAPANLLRRVAENYFSTTEKFFLRYGLILTIVLVATIVVLLLILVFLEL